MIMNNKTLKIFEYILNGTTLIWLLAISYLSRPLDIHIDSFPEAAYQYGQVYMITITMTLIASSIIIWRLIRPSKWLRITTLSIIIATIFITVYFNIHNPPFNEFIRIIIYGQ